MVLNNEKGAGVDPDPLSHQPVRQGACQYIRGHDTCQSSSLQALRCSLAGVAIVYRLKGDLLTLNETAHSCAFNGGDVHEYVVPATFRSDKAKAFCRAEEFYYSNGDKDLPSKVINDELHH